MKFLVICAGGNVRSRALVYRLNYHHGQDALSASADKNTAETMRMLAAWADRIVLMQEKFITSVPVDHHKKVVVCDVGEDNYGSPWHFHLQEKVEKFARGWAARDFALDK